MKYTIVIQWSDEDKYTVAKWGNSLAVRIPQNLAKEISLAEGVEIDLRIVE